MNGCIDLPAVRGKPTARLRIICAVNLRNLAGGQIFFKSDTANEVAVSESHLPARGEPEELLRRLLHEILPLDEQVPGEGDLPGARIGIFRVIGTVEHLDLPLRIVVDHDAKRPENRQNTQRLFIEVVPNAVL